MNILDNIGHLVSTLLQLLLISIIMYLTVRKIPTIIQGLLAGNPSLAGNDMTGTVVQMGTAAATVGGMAVGANTAAMAYKAAAGEATTGWRASSMGQFARAAALNNPLTRPFTGAYRQAVRETVEQGGDSVSQMAERAAGGVARYTKDIGTDNSTGGNGTSGGGAPSPEGAFNQGRENVSQPSRETSPEFSEQSKNNFSAYTTPPPTGETRTTPIRSEAMNHIHGDKDGSSPTANATANVNTHITMPESGISPTDLKPNSSVGKMTDTTENMTNPASNVANAAQNKANTVANQTAASEKDSASEKAKAARRALFQDSPF